MAFEYADDMVGFLNIESALGTVAKPAATDAFRARAISIDPVYERHDPGDRRNTFSLLERVEGRHSAKWAATVLLRPSGTAGTPPDFGDFLTLLLGTEGITTSTSVVYSQLKDRSALYATIWRELTDTHVFARGAICNQCVITWSGRDFVTLQFSGPAKEYGWASETTVTSDCSATAIVAVTDADFFSSYATVKVGIDDNTDAGYQITAVNYTTNKITLETASASAVTSAVVAHYLPTPTIAGDPIYGTKGSLTLTEGAWGILGGSITINNGLDLDNREFGTSTPHDVISTGKWSITGTVNLAVDKTDFALLAHAVRQVQTDVVLVLGDTTAKKMQLDMNIVEFDPVPLTVPDSGLVEVAMPFTALGSSGEDDITITFA